MLSDATFNLFTPCDILDVTTTQKQNSDSLVWVSHVNCILTMSLDNVYLLVDDSTFASTNNKYLEDSRANRRDLQWSAAPALQLTFDSADQFHDLVQVLADLCSSFVRKQTKKEQKRKLLDCCIPVRLRTSGVNRACEVRDQAPTRHRQ